MAADVSVIRAIDHHETATISTIITTTQPKPAPGFQARDAATRFRTHASGQGWHGNRMRRSRIEPG